MTPQPSSETNILLDLDARQDEVLARLEELDKRVEQVLRECQPSPRPADVGGG